MNTVTLPRSVVEQALDALQDADTIMEHRQDVELRRSAMTALRTALEQPQVEQELDAFDEWWRMRPSLTRLQAWLLWKDEQKQLERAHGIGGEA